MYNYVKFFTSNHRVSRRRHVLSC